MQTMERPQVVSSIVALTYLTVHQKTAKVYLLPTTEQQRNGEVMEETYEGSGIFKGRLLSGKEIHLKLDRIVQFDNVGA